ncbi:MAG: hypothetical protein ACOCRX_00335 [Candidatus Woesearchaeota archaeon]
MSLVDKIKNMKDSFKEFNFKFFLESNRDFNNSFYIKDHSKKGYENSLFNNLKKIKTMLNYDDDFVFDFLKNSYESDGIGVVNPEMYCLGLRRIYFDNNDLSYSSDMIDILEKDTLDEPIDNIENTRRINPANNLINSFSYTIIHYFTKNEEILKEAKIDLSKANSYYFDNDDFYDYFVSNYSKRDLACFKLQYSNSLVDLSYIAYDTLEKKEKKEIKSVIKDAKDYRRYLKRYDF